MYYSWSNRIWRVLAASLCLISLTFSVSGCAEKETAPEQQYMKVGTALYNVNDTYLSELMECFRKDMENYETVQFHVTVNVRDGALAQRTEDQQVEELLDAGSDILCVNLVDRTAPSRIIDLAREKNIPVIFFNREPVKEDLLSWDQLYYIGSQARESGVLQGELAADYIREHPGVDRNRDGKIQYIILEGEPDHQDAIIRTESSVSTLMEQGIELEKLSCQVANWNRSQARTKMSQMITRYGRGIELVLANNDEMAIGAMDAYDQANITVSDRPAVFGVDGTREGLKALKDGMIQGTVYHNMKGEAGAMAQLAHALYEARSHETEPDLSGLNMTRDRTIYLSYAKVTADNVEELMNAAGQ